MISIVFKKLCFTKPGDSVSARYFKRKFSSRKELAKELFASRKRFYKGDRESDNFFLRFPMPIIENGDTHTNADYSAALDIVYSMLEEQNFSAVASQKMDIYRLIDELSD